MSNRTLPRTIEAFAALDHKGQIIANSVRESTDAVRLAAGECEPIPVRVTPIYLCGE